MEKKATRASSLRRAVVVACMAALICVAVAPSAAHAAMTKAEWKTTDDGLRYAIGDFASADWGLTSAVYCGQPQELAKELEAKWNAEAQGAWTSTAVWRAPAYGVLFDIQERRTVNSAASPAPSGTVRQGERYVGAACGRGVYIVGDTSDGEGGKKLIIPDTIEGLPVVYVNVRGDSGVDISRCASLKYFSLRGGSAKLGPANGKSLVTIKIDSFNFAERVTSIDLSPAQNAREIAFFFSPANFTLPLNELRSLVFSSDGQCGLEQLDVSHAAKLEQLHVDSGDLSGGSLNLDGCTALKDLWLEGNAMTSLDVSKFPALRTLNVEYNYISDLTQIIVWGSQPGHTLYADDQRTPEKKIDPRAVSLSATSFVYDGKEKRPTVTVAGLKEGADFRVDYRHNVQVGTATASVTGLNGYRGNLIAKTFTIKAVPAPAPAKPSPAPAKPASPQSIAKAKVTVKDRAYTGKAQKASSVTVKLGGKTLKEGRDYRVSCKAGKSVGSYKVTVKGKGSYTGTKTAAFKINPKATSVKRLKKTKRGFTVTWKKPSKAALKQTTGYQVRWSLKSSMKGAKAKAVKTTSSAGKKCTLKVAKLKAGKKYYVQVRAYKKAAGKTYYSSWSKARAVKAGR